MKPRGIFARAFLSYSRAKIEDIVEKRCGPDEKEVMRLVERACRSDEELGLSAAVARDAVTIAFAITVSYHVVEVVLAGGSAAESMVPLVAAYDHISGTWGAPIAVSIPDTSSDNHDYSHIFM